MLTRSHWMGCSLKSRSGIDPSAFTIEGPLSLWASLPMADPNQSCHTQQGENDTFQQVTYGNQNEILDPGFLTSMTYTDLHKSSWPSNPSGTQPVGVDPWDSCSNFAPADCSATGYTTQYTTQYEGSTAGNTSGVVGQDY